MIQVVTPCDIKLVFVQKITPVLRKIDKTAAIRAALSDSNMHQIVCRPRLHCIWGSLQRSPIRHIYSCIYAREGGSSSFALGRKKKSRRLRLLLRNVAFRKWTIHSTLPTWLRVTTSSSDIWKKHLRGRRFSSDIDVSSWLERVRGLEIIAGGGGTRGSRGQKSPSGVQGRSLL